jgi:transcriptional regulator with XRE-family HTH domain
MIDSVPVRRKLVGAALRAYRLRAGYELAGAASVLECDRSKISRIETGQRGIRPKELRELLTEYEVSETEKTALVTIARPPSPDRWWQDHDNALTDADRDYAQLEMIATRIQVYEPALVPALLQVPAYAEAVAGTGPWQAPGEPRLPQAALTLARQRAILDQRHPELAVLIDEAALHRPVGGAEVMREQMIRLAGTAEGTEPVTVQVLPLSGGASAAGAGGPVTILQFTTEPAAGGNGLGLVCLPRHGHDGSCLVTPRELASYTRMFAALTAAALSPARSARLLRELAGNYHDALPVPAAVPAGDQPPSHAGSGLPMTEAPASSSGPATSTR